MAYFFNIKMWIESLVFLKDLFIYLFFVKHGFNFTVEWLCFACPVFDKQQTF